jgi:signal peptidase II
MSGSVLWCVSPPVMGLASPLKRKPLDIDHDFVIPTRTEAESMAVSARGRVFWPMASLMLLADCSTKRAIEEALPVAGESKPIIDHFLQFTLAYNQGAAFATNLGSYQRWVMIGLVLAVLLVLARSYRPITQRGLLGTVGLALIVGGAAGNLLDRIMSARGVVDFIDVGIGSSRFYLFNVADAGVSVGAAVLAYVFWREARAERRRRSFAS